MNKKLLCLFLSVVILFTSLCLIINKYIFLSADSVVNNKFTIILDAGHGGEDGGAIAADGSLEKDYNLDISLELESILKLYGFNVIMTRTTDTMTCDDNLDTQRQKKISDIKNRAELMKIYPDAIFVSIHQNKFSDINQKGTQVFYSSNHPDSYKLADLIQQSVVKELQNDNKRKIKKSGTEIYLLYHAEIPAVLVECGFLSNINDLESLKNENYRTKIAICIADGIIKFFNVR